MNSLLFTNKDYDYEADYYLKLINETVALQVKQLPGSAEKQHTTNSQKKEKSQLQILRSLSSSSIQQSRDSSEQQNYTNSSTGLLKTKLCFQIENDQCKDDKKGNSSLAREVFGGNLYFQEARQQNDFYLFSNRIFEPTIQNDYQQNCFMKEHLSCFFQQEIHCFCNIQISVLPTRHLLLRSIEDIKDIGKIIIYLETFGDLQNIDQHQYAKKRILSVSYFSEKSTKLALTSISQYKEKFNSNYLQDSNDFDFIDYMIVANADEFSIEELKLFFEHFGDIKEIKKIKDQILISFDDLRSLREIERFVAIQNSDRKHLSFNRLIYRIKQPESFINSVLSKILIFNQENTTAILINSSSNNINFHPYKYDKDTNVGYIQNQGFYDMNYALIESPEDSRQILPNRSDERLFKTHVLTSNQEPTETTDYKFFLEQNLHFHPENHLAKQQKLSSKSQPFDSRANKENIFFSDNIQKPVSNDSDNLYQKNKCNGSFIQEHSKQTLLLNDNFAINLVSIQTQNDNRTTIMIRNIPNRFGQQEFLNIIDIKFKGLYDFIYLPMDFNNFCNIGYAFINFLETDSIIDLYNAFHGRRWDNIKSEKVCIICYARIQGRNELISHFKKSGVMNSQVQRSFKPIILPNPKLDIMIL